MYHDKAFENKHINKGFYDGDSLYLIEYAVYKKLRQTSFKTLKKAALEKI